MKRNILVWALGISYTGIHWLDSREPLPSVVNQLFPSHSQGARLVLGRLIRSLNSLNGEGIEGPEVASEYQRTVLDGLMSDCERAANWRMEGKAPSWVEFFKVKGVDYKGEEVLTAQEMRWENVASALPQGSRNSAIGGSSGTWIQALRLKSRGPSGSSSTEGFRASR